jgi:hypothetical protein
VDDLDYVVGRDFPKLIGVGFFDEGFVMAVDDVRRDDGPPRGLGLVLIGTANTCRFTTTSISPLRYQLLAYQQCPQLDVCPTAEPCPLQTLVWLLLLLWLLVILEPGDGVVGSPERSLHARLLQVRLSLEDVL